MDKYLFGGFLGCLYPYCRRQIDRFEGFNLIAPDRDGIIDIINICPPTRTYNYREGF